MDGSTLVALAGIGSSTVVGLWVPFFTARRTADREHDRAAADDRREGRRLEAEQQRLTSQLGHERASRDLGELRALLDDFVAAIPPAIDAVVVLQSKSGRDEEPTPAAYMTEMRAHRDTAERLLDLQTRLLVRLGREHPVLLASIAVTEAISGPGAEVVTQITLEQPPPVGRPEVYLPGRQRMHATRAAFLDAATTLVGVRLPVV